MNKSEYPLVSIIVITYNSAKYVLETLESAKAQTYQNIELIVSDDGSTDNTVAICEKWIEENKGRFIHTKLITSPQNTGTSINCNRGSNAATGEWVKLIAGDDILLKNCIVHNLNYIKKNKTEIVFSDIIWFSDHFTDTENYDGKGNERYAFGKLSNQEQLKFYSRNPLFLNIPSLFFSMRLLKNIDFFDEDFKILEDQPFVFKVLLAGYSFRYLHIVTVKYRRHSGAVQNFFSKEFKQEIRKSYWKYRKKNLNCLNYKDFLSIVEFHTYSAVLFLRTKRLYFLSRVINRLRPEKLLGI